MVEFVNEGIDFNKDENDDGIIPSVNDGVEV